MSGWYGEGPILSEGPIRRGPTHGFAGAGVAIAATAVTALAYSGPWNSALEWLVIGGAWLWIAGLARYDRGRMNGGQP